MEKPVSVMLANQRKMQWFSISNISLLSWWDLIQH